MPPTTPKWKEEFRIELYPHQLEWLEITDPMKFLKEINKRDKKILKFISSLLAEVIEEIPTLVSGYSIQEPTAVSTVQDLTKVKQQLRNKYL